MENFIKLKKKKEERKIQIHSEIFVEYIQEWMSREDDQLQIYFK